MLGFVLVLSCVLIAITTRLRSKSRLGHGMPPGPKGLPLIGNLLQIPQFQFIRLTEWKAQYGPLFSLNLAGQRIVVISGIKVAGDLLERRSAIYSDRPRFIVSSELVTGQLFFPIIKYGDVWKKLRKAAHDGLKSQIIHTYQPGQELEAIILAEGLIQHPESWTEVIKRSAASSTKTAIYGAPPLVSNDDPIVTFIDNLAHRITLGVEPGRYLVEFFPKMLYLPTWLAPWKRKLATFHEQDTQTLKELVQAVKEDVDDGIYKPSFAAEVYLNRHRHSLTQKEEAWLSGTMFLAGSDTTSATFRFFILAMRLYPKVMKKAQAELDRVVGRGRAPDFSDRDKLPYVSAMIKETLRWGPTAPVGVPHQTLQDDFYDGHFIPSGTLVFINCWGMNNDPEIFSDPYEFRPERFLDPSETVEVSVPGTRGQGHVTFGFGRRFCAGVNLAVQHLFINIATVLWAANVEPGYDKDGQIVTPSNTPACWIDEGNVVVPVPFPCNIVPRFKGVEEVLHRAKEERSC